MGIINLTPDSFSDGGRHMGVDDAVAHALKLAADGADVLDLGAESTRPGHVPVSEAVEMARLLPPLLAIRKVLPDMPLSVDSFKPEVASSAIRAGADIINDVWGGAHGASARYSPMCELAARLGAPLILMHNRESVAAPGMFWDSFLGDMRRAVAQAQTAGIRKEQLWLDPGFGFGKTPAQNLECLRELRRLCALGFPVLLGTSRKSTLGLVLGASMEARDAGTIATNVWGIAEGAQMLRIHDVAAMRPHALMADAIRKAEVGGCGGSGLT
jgi:dihydropteroate synthase